VILTLATTYDDIIEDIVQVVEATGAAIMILGGLAALVVYAARSIQTGRYPRAYQDLRQQLGRAILLGLEVLIIGDIVRTIVVEPTMTSVGVLGLIVIIRIVLSFSLEIEIDGTLPWRRAAEVPEAEDSAAES
jgi:uncharacterized membrane protein